MTKHERIFTKGAGGGGADDDVTEALEALSKSVNDMGESSKAALAKITTELASEKKEREGLELKIGRLSLSSTGGGGGFDRGALNDEREALGAYIAKGDNSKLLELKAMSVGSDPNGGYVVLPQLSASMNTKIFDQSPMKRLSRVITMTDGDSWEEVIDKDEPDAEWVAETQSRNETGTPELGKHKVTLHEIHASPKTTQKLLETSYMDVGAWLEGKVADKFGRTEGMAYNSGDGVGKPFGLLSGIPVATSDATRAWGTLQYFPSGAASTLLPAAASDVFRDVMWGLRAPYRKGASWLMNSNTASAIDKLKNSTGDYIWRDGMTAGAPPSLLGYPVEFDENMPDIGANAFPVAFGNFKLGYVIIELNGLRVLRDPFTAKPNVVFYAYKRVGGDISNSEAIKLVKIATT